jgi:Bromodomain
MLKKFLRRESAAPFAEPVPLDLVPGYAEAIARPADLGTVLATLQREQYATLGAPLPYAPPLPGSWLPIVCTPAGDAEHLLVFIGSCNGLLTARQPACQDRRKMQCLAPLPSEPSNLSAMPRQHLAT